jgi:hypothetical protein
MLEVGFVEQPMGRTQVSAWCTKFKVGVTPVEDAERTGLPLTAKRMQQWIQLVLKTCRSTIL